MRNFAGFCLWGCLFSACIAIVAQAESSRPKCILFEDSYGKRLESRYDDISLWWASSGWKVSVDRSVPKAKSHAVSIALARNEREAVQLVLRPAKPLSSFIARAGVLTGPEGATIAAENIEVLRVRYVKVERTSDITSAKALWPDPLPPFVKPIDLPVDKNQPLWIRVYVPKGTRAGEYEGRIALRADGYEDEVALSVQVYDFDLPDNMTCETAFGFNVGAIFEYQKVTDPDQRQMVLEKYMASLGSHHITPYDPTPNVHPKVTWVKLTAEQAAEYPETERPVLQDCAVTAIFDWTEWDAEFKRVHDKYGFDSFRLGLPGMGGGEVAGFAGGTRERALAFKSYAQGWQEHLREKGWLKMAYVYWIDEPTTKEYKYVMDGFEELRLAAPDIRRMLTEQPEEELVGGPNLWCPLTGFYKHEKTMPPRERGDKFWWYVCTVPKQPYCGLFTDHPATDLRVWLWQTWQYDIEGILIWASNLWTTGMAYPDKPQNPYEDPMSWMTGYGTKVGDKRPWGNGDGRFMYPPEAAADANPPAPVLDGPVDSIRWEMLRDGLEDYEYLVILKRLLAEKREEISWLQEPRYAKLLEIPDSISKDLKHYTKDPAPVEKRRDAIAHAIEKLSRK